MKYYPTKLHEAAANKFVEIFSKDNRVNAILLICSCARGRASKDSCVDLGVIINNWKNYNAIEKKFNSLEKKVKEFRDLSRAGKYAHVDLHITTGKIEQKERGWTTGPDEFELEIGNIFKYSVVLFDRNRHFEKLKRKYLPYYSEALRKKKLKEVKRYMYNNIEHIPSYVKRGLYFQSFSRLYNASREFLQALFIKRKVYPISYDKWIREQIVDILDEPKLYKEFVSLYEIRHLESNELARKAKKLKSLAENYL